MPHWPLDMNSVVAWAKELEPRTLDNSGSPDRSPWPLPSIRAQPRIGDNVASFDPPTKLLVDSNSMVSN
jgi:hypothetical protein